MNTQKPESTDLSTELQDLPLSQTDEPASTARARFFTESHWTFHWPAWLIFAALILLPVGRTVELPTLIMAIAGAMLIWHQGSRLYRVPGQRYFALLFLCIWIPMVVSWFGAVNMSKATSAVLTFPRLYLAGVFVVWAMSVPARQQLVLKLAALMVAFWVLDALIQAVFGQDIFGFRYVPPRLNGIYGETHLDLGVALPTLAPLLLLSLRRNLACLVAASLLTGLVVFMAGSRGGWVSYGLVLLVLAAHEWRLKNLRWKQLTLAAVLFTGIGWIILHFQPETEQRLQQSLDLFSGDWEQVNQATSLRLQIWSTALRMAEAHPFNGVGVGGFRYAYVQHANHDDIFVDAQTGTGPFYAHQLLVQVGSETGLVGLAGLGLFYVVWLRTWRQSPQEAKTIALPFALSALAWLFPLNTHASFYSAQWSQLIWLLLALYCSSLSISGNGRHPA